MPLFYSMQRKVPPLPFNPFPELPVFKLETDKFAYDDRELDYAARLAVTPEDGEAKITFEIAVNEGQNSPLAAFAADEIGLRISRTGSNTFSLLLTNLTVGVDYLVTDKFQITNDIAANWRPLSLFTANSNSATLTGTFAENKQFFRVWNYDAYQGPVISLTTPYAGATLSGRVKVTGIVSDIFPGRVAELYVDDDLVTAVTNGPLELELDTQQFTNGVHVLNVVVRTVELTTNLFELSSVATVTVNFSNFLASIDNGPFFSGGSTILKYSTTGQADYTLQIFDASNTLRRTFQGTKSAGLLQISWDGRDSGGNLLPTESRYTFKMTAVAAGAAAAAGPTNQVITPSFSEGSFNAGYAYLLRNKLTLLFTWLEETEREQLDRISAYIFAADLFGPDPVDTRTVLNDQVFVWQTDSQKTNILNSIKRKDVGHVFYVGHGGGGGFGSGEGTLTSTTISYAELRDSLTNYFDARAGTYDFKNPKRFVEIAGCGTGTSFLQFGFGIPRFNMDRRPTMARRTFFGWNNTITFGIYATRYQRHIDQRNWHWHNPDEQVSIQIAMVRAIIEEDYDIDLREFALLGSRLLTWAVNAQ